MKTLFHSVLGTVLMLLSGALLASELSQGDLRLSGAWARATVPAQQASGAFITIANTGKQADRLLAVTGDLAQSVELHSMAMDGDKMVMRPVSAIEIPAGGRVELKPGAFHIMFQKLRAPLKAGSSVPLSLLFERAGEVRVSFEIVPLDAAGPTHMH